MKRLAIKKMIFIFLLFIPFSPIYPESQSPKPFHETFWFQIIVFLLLILLFIIIHYLRTKKLRQKISKNEREQKTSYNSKEDTEEKIKELELMLDERTLQLTKVNKELKRVSKIDSVTGIPNYNQFNEFFYQEWRRSTRYSRPLSIIMINIDFFIPYNETYDQEAGENCLKKIAQMLKEIIKRPGDIVARYGAEEFIIVLSETNSKNSADIAEMIRVGAEFLKIENKESKISEFVTISLGCATTVPKKDNDPSSLIKAADDALSLSQQNGKNRVTTADPLS